MGCGASKGKSEEGNTENANIEFKETGVHSLDDFFDQAKKILESFKDITGPLGEQKDNFFEATGFYEVPGAEVQHAFSGMFLSMSALCNGEMESMNTQWGKSAPYVEINTSAIGKNGQNMYEGFVNYINALQKCLTEQMPDVLEQAERLPNEADKVKDRAADQLEALDFMKKSKALMAFAFNLKQLSKVPAYIKKAIEGFKGDLQEVMDAKEKVQTEFESFKVKGAECASAGVKDAVPCYKRVYGPIKYTMAQRQEWEEKMRDIVWRKFTKRFDPMQYPLTDLIEDGAKH